MHRFAGPAVYESSGAARRGQYVGAASPRVTTGVRIVIEDDHVGAVGRPAFVREKRCISAEDANLQISQGFVRIDAEVGDEEPAKIVIGRERLDLPAAAI